MWPFRSADRNSTADPKEIEMDDVMTPAEIS